MGDNTINEVSDLLPFPTVRRLQDLMHGTEHALQNQKQ
jgi:hypothetical protein